MLRHSHVGRGCCTGGTKKEKQYYLRKHPFHIGKTHDKRVGMGQEAPAPHRKDIRQASGHGAVGDGGVRRTERALLAQRTSCRSMWGKRSHTTRWFLGLPEQNTCNSAWHWRMMAVADAMPLELGCCRAVSRAAIACATSRFRRIHCVDAWGAQRLPDTNKGTVPACDKETLGTLGSLG
jgi:hypothetical protein